MDIVNGKLMHYRVVISDEWFPRLFYFTGFTDFPSFTDFFEFPGFPILYVKRDYI